MKTVIYTAITANYDSLKQIRNQNPNFDLICFTDNQNLRYNSYNWNIYPIPTDLLSFSKIKQQRLLKILPHKYLTKYDISIWIDGNITIIGDMQKYIDSLDLNKYSFYTKKHPSRDCLYEEAKAINRYGKENPVMLNMLVNRYKNENVPEHIGLHETSVIIRRHNDVKCKILGNMWAKELIENSHRDQMSFDYCRWKLGYEIGELNIESLRTDSNFRWEKHNG